MADLKTLKDVRFLQKELRTVGTEDQVKICKILKQLSKLPISVDILQATGIGKLVNNYRKCGGKVTDYSRFLVQKWKEVLIRETQSKGKRGHHSESEDESMEEKTTESHQHLPEKEKMEDGHSLQKNRNESHMKESPAKDRHGRHRTDLQSHHSPKKHIPNKERNDREGLPNKERTDNHKPVLPNKARYESPNRDSPNKVKHGSSSKSKYQHDKNYEQHSYDHHELEKVKMSDNYQTTDKNQKSKVKQSQDDVLDFPKNDKHNSEKSTHQLELKKKDATVVKKLTMKRKRPKVKDEEITHDSGMSFAECLNLDVAKPKKIMKQDKEKVTVTVMPVSMTQVKPSSTSGTTSQETYDGQYPIKKHKEKKKHKHKHHGRDREHKHKHRHREKVLDVPERHDLQVKNLSSDGKRRKLEMKSSPDQSMAKKVKSNAANTDMSQGLPNLTLNTDYKPLRLPTLDDLPRRKTFGMDDGALSTVNLTSKQTRTKVFSGKARVNVYDHVPSLFDTCMRVLSENIELLEDVGGVPFDILQPVLERCTAEQLFRLEDFNPHFLEDSGELWQKHCLRDFKGSRPDEFESWRELYLRKLDERKERLEKITANIQASMAQKKPERQMKLAYMSGPAKPPRNVQRRQARLGTAGPASQHKSPHRSAIPAFRPSSSSSGSHRDGHSGGDSARAAKPAKIIPPMMMKSLKMMRGLKR